MSDLVDLPFLPIDGDISHMESSEIGAMFLELFHVINSRHGLDALFDDEVAAKLVVASRHLMFAWNAASGIDSRSDEEEAL